jgi:hypothetical protein
MESSYPSNRLSNANLTSTYAWRSGNMASPESIERVVDLVSFAPDKNGPGWIFMASDPKGPGGESAK